MNDLISIIVPVYNVQKFLPQCIDSIIHQTYKNLQIILVDDGSTDDSGRLCDAYAEMDNRIIVVHKKNGGLSDARNTGMKIAEGRYIGFVDSDDYIDCNMYSELYQLCKKYSVKMSCARYDEFGTGKIDILPEPTGQIKKMRGEELLWNIIAQDEKIFASISVWDRLYHKDILKNLMFPKGKCYEDIVFSTKAILNAGEIAYINKALYHYRIRMGSITQSDKAGGFDVKVITDRLPLQLEQIEYFESNGYELLVNGAKAAYYQDFIHFLSVNTDSRYDAIINNMLERWRLSIEEIVKLPLKRKRKFMLIIKIIFPTICCKLKRHIQNRGLIRI